jgi:hypothetical protein
MKTVVIALIFFIIGGVLGGFAALAFGVGFGAASGLVMGTQAGACMAVDAAKNQGLLSGDGADRVIAETVARIKRRAGNVPEQAKMEWVRNAADCARIIADMDKGTPQASR